MLGKLIAMDCIFIFKILSLNGGLTMNNFHGLNKKKSYFEGWYLKHQNKNNTISFIPAFHINEHGIKSASIQIITDNLSYNINYPIKGFTVCENKFFVKIGDNMFSSEGIFINIKTKNLSICGEIKYGLLTCLKSDIMGPFHFIPNMQCNHGILSLRHSLYGKLNINGEIFNFDNGIGYIEKDWGFSFPSAYMWTQCNNFSNKDCCIFVSIANIPFLGLSFTGCICCIYYGGREYRLATYNGVKIVKFSRKEVILQQSNYVLIINLIDGISHNLFAPKKGEMTRVIRESPSCKVRYRFYYFGNKLFDLTSDKAGFEYSDSGNDVH